MKYQLSMPAVDVQKAPLPIPLINWPVFFFTIPCRTSIDFHQQHTTWSSQSGKLQVSSVSAPTKKSKYVLHILYNPSFVWFLDVIYLTSFFPCPTTTPSRIFFRSPPIHWCFAFQHRTNGPMTKPSGKPSDLQSGDRSRGWGCLVDELNLRWFVTFDGFWANKLNERKSFQGELRKKRWRIFF